MNIQYLLLFFVGGFFMSMHKYITNEISPKLGAILITFPIGLLSAYFIIDKDKISHYIRNYIKQIAFIMLISSLYLLMFEKQIMNHKYILLTISSIWVIFAIGEMFS